MLRYAATARDAAREQALDPGAEHVLQRAGEQDHQSLEHDHHVAGHVGHVEGQFRAALVEHAEEQRGEQDAHRVVAAHQRHRDADEAVARRELQQQPVVDADDLVHADEAGKTAGDRHRQHDRARRRDAAVDRSRLVVADGADLVAPARAPDEEPEEHEADRGDDDAEVE